MTRLALILCLLVPLTGVAQTDTPTETPTETATETPTQTPTVSPTPTCGTSTVVNVVTDHDDGCCDVADCTFREALSYSSSGDSITFAPSTNGVTQVLTLGQITLDHTLTITGNGPTNTLISGGDTSRILQFSAGDLTISGMTFEHGRAVLAGAFDLESPGNTVLTNCVFDHNVGNAAPSGARQGGAIFQNDGTLTISNSVFTTNTARLGGAIQASGLSLTVTDTTFDANSTSGNTGGAIVISTVNPASFTGCTFSNNAVNGSSGTAGALSINIDTTVTNSTFANNVVTVGAAGIACGGAIDIGTGTLTLNNDTFSGNAGWGCASGGNIGVSGAAMVASNTIIVGGSPDDCGNAGGTFTSNGYNIESGTSCGFTATGDQQNANPALYALANNGGQTDTMAIDNTSVAYNAANNATCEATDQRGVTRPQFTTCDVGAYELAPTPTATPTTTGSQVATNTPTETPTMTPTHATPTFTNTRATSTPTSTPTNTPTATTTMTAAPTIDIKQQYPRERVEFPLLVNATPVPDTAAYGIDFGPGVTCVSVPEVIEGRTKLRLRCTVP